MKTIAISGSRRENVGKRDAKELRYAGKVPAVLYGGAEQLHFSVTASDLKDVIYTPDVNFVDLDVEGIKAKAIVQDVQVHPLTEKLVHIDFLELNDKKPITMQVPVKLTGTSPGVKTGGKLTQKLRRLGVRALPQDMPQYVNISIEKLEVGKSVRVGELQFDKFTITNSPEDTIVSVLISRVLKTAEGETAAS